MTVKTHFIRRNEVDVHLVMLSLNKCFDQPSRHESCQFPGARSHPARLGARVASAAAVLQMTSPLAAGCWDPSKTLNLINQRQISAAVLQMTYTSITSSALHLHQWFSRGALLASLLTILQTTAPPASCWGPSQTLKPLNLTPLHQPNAAVLQMTTPPASCWDPS